MVKPWERNWQTETVAPRPWERDWSGATEPAEPAEPAAPLPGARGLQIGAQGAGRGVAELAGMPVDLVSLIVNGAVGAVEGGVNTAANWIGIEDDVSLPRITNPIGGGDWIRSQAGNAFEAAGGDLIDPEDMSFDERLAYNVNRFGTEALIGGGALAARGAARAATPNAAPQFGDFLSRAYAGPNASTALRADIAGGGGMGAGVTLAEEYFPDNEWANLAGALGGGVAGSVAGAGLSLPRAVGQFVHGMSPDPNIPYPAGTMAPTSRRVSNATAAMFQNQASNPAQASARIGERQSLADQFNEPMPTSGIASDDTGLIAMELGARQDGSSVNPNLRTQFVERDAAIQARGAENINSLRDQGADMPGALDYAQNRPNEIAAARDAAALPILRQAEASGAVIDAQPVADTIDRMLSTTKRPAVVNALREARERLNSVGTDQLDTSVSGLYETRKAINDIIQGRTDTPTGRYAQSELIEVRNALDEAINNAVPEFGQYLDTYRDGSRALDVFEQSQSVARLMGEERDLRNVAKRILSSGDYGSDQLMREINSVISNSPDAQRAWRAAVADELGRRVQTTREGGISLAAYRRTFNQHEAAMSEVFSPEDMSILQRGHEIFAPLENLSQSVRAGSQTADNQQLTNALEGAILAGTGNAITTGMIMRRLRVAANLLGLGQHTMPHKMKALAERAYFDPDLMRHLLEAPVSESTGPLWNGRLRNLLAAGEFSRESTDSDERDIPQITVNYDSNQPSMEELIMQGGQ